MLLVLFVVVHHVITLNHYSFIVGTALNDRIIHKIARVGYACTRRILETPPTRCDTWSLTEPYYSALSHTDIPWDNLYPYTTDLLALDACTPCRTPLAWKHALQTHNYIINELTDGFRIWVPVWGTSHLNKHPEVVTAYLQKEQSLLGPSHPLPPTRFGVIPKGHNTGKWRLITDLSHPPMGSVNSGIEPELCSLSYTTVDDIANRILHIGKGALLAKVDIEAAYRLIPVHPDDRPVQWNGSMFIDPISVRHLISSMQLRTP